MSKNNQSYSSGIGFTGALFLVFLILKLINIITWSWWWITAPLWVPFVLVMIFIVIFGLITIRR